jgi:minor histocompatibility antigen H13
LSTLRAGLLAGLALRFDAFAARTAAAAALGGAAVAAVAIKQGADSSKWQHQQAVAITSTSSSSSEEAWMPDESALESRPMFKRVVAAHIVGLLGAFAANSITHLGQPALLYIVPAMLGTVFATAAAQGQLSDVWSWTDRASFGMAAAEGAADDKQQEQQGGKR